MAPKNGKLVDHLSLGVLTRIIPRYIVDEILAQSERVEKRSRLLPAHVVVYFAVALAIFADGYEEVLRKLVNGLQFARTWSKQWTVPSTSAISQARTRLGEQPLALLFDRVAEPIAQPGTPGAWLRSWRLMAIDGVMIDIPDTPENLAQYPKAEGGTRRPFPQTRTVALAECGTHAIVGASIGSIRTGERELSTPLISKIRPDMVILADRGFYSFQMYRSYLATGAQLIWRLWSNVYPQHLADLPDGSYLAEITSQHGRAGKTRIDLSKIDNPLLATHIPVRIIEYQVDDEQNPGTAPETIRLITTILDPAQASATEIATAYHQRWELESTFRELETYLRSGRGIRSKSPEMVRQEIWALLLAHYAIRAFMVEAADTVDIDPDRISFTRTLHVVRRQIIDPAEFSPRSSESSATRSTERDRRTPD
jgi:hypothetical protein